jgi:hypothetical protein
VQESGLRRQSFGRLSAPLKSQKTKGLIHSEPKDLSRLLQAIRRLNLHHTGGGIKEIAQTVGNNLMPETVAVDFGILIRLKVCANAATLIRNI